MFFLVSLDSSKVNLNGADFRIEFYFYLYERFSNSIVTHEFGFQVQDIYHLCEMKGL
jgi:hypothetical protein